MALSEVSDDAIELINMDIHKEVAHAAIEVPKECPPGGSIPIAGVGVSVQGHDHVAEAWGQRHYLLMKMLIHVSKNSNPSQLERRLQGMKAVLMELAERASCVA